MLVAVTVVVAACSVVYELLAAQTLAALAANTVTWYSVVIGTFLGAMGLGALHCQRRGAREDSWRDLVRVELQLCAAGLAIVPLIHFGHMFHGYLTVHSGPFTAGVAFFGTAFGMTALVGFLTGIELPLLMSIAEVESEDRAMPNVILGLDYVGSLIGALAFPLLLLPSLDLLSVAVIAAATNLSVAVWIISRRLATDRTTSALVGPAVALAAGLVLLATTSGRIEQYFLHKYYYYPHTSASLSTLLAPMDGYPKVERYRSAYQRIDIMTDIDGDISQQLMPFFSAKTAEEPDFPRDHILFLNGDFQTNTTYEEIYHEWFAHVPISAYGKVPKRVLLLGGGDGILLRELLKYDGIEELLHVDIDPVLPELARTHPVLSRVNGGAFDNPRLERMRSDGFRFVRETDRTFDAVYIDFPVAVDYDLSRLYSREFFHFVLRRLAPDGFAVFDSTGTSLVTAPDADGKQFVAEGNDWSIYCNTLMAAGFPQIIPYLTTMEVDNDDAYEWLTTAQIEFTVGLDFKQAWESADTEEEREVLKDLLARQVITQHMISLQQGFVMLGASQESLQPDTWTDPGVTLHMLDEARYHKAFEVKFPFPDEPDPDLVNSILQPRFPTMPIWTPRKPY